MPSKLSLNGITGWHWGFVVQRSGVPGSSTISEPQSKDFCDCLRIVE